MTTPIIIREARLEDACAIAVLVTQLGYPTAADEMGFRLAWLLRRPDHVLFVAEAPAGVVGLVGAYLAEALEFNGKYGRLTGMVMNEHWRGLGIGRLLLERIESWLIEQGALLSILTSGIQRKESHHFYRHLGYAETGLRFAKQLGSAGQDRQLVIGDAKIFALKRLEEVSWEACRHGFRYIG